MSEAIRFYLDEHVAHAIARGLSIRGVDVLTAAAANMLEATDIEHLNFATSEKRVIFSQDADFLRLHADQGHLIRAATVLNQAIRLDADCSCVYCWRALVYAELGQIDDACADLNKAAEISPTY